MFFCLVRCCSPNSYELYFYVYSRAMQIAMPVFLTHSKHPSHNFLTPFMQLLQISRKKHSTTYFSIEPGGGRRSAATGVIDD